MKIGRCPIEELAAEASGLERHTRGREGQLLRQHDIAVGVLASEHGCAVGVNRELPELELLGSPREALRLKARCEQDAPA